MHESAPARYRSGRPEVSSHPVIPFIEGDGIGPEIMKAARDILDTAVEKAFGGERVISWLELPAGEKALQTEGDVLPKRSVDEIRRYGVALKGPLITPVGAGYRSVNVRIRQDLDLYAGVRPARWYPGVPSPVCNPERVNFVVFRENTEDVYAGIEWEKGSPGAKEVLLFLKERFGREVREDSGLALKPISEFASKRLVRKALFYAIERKLPSVTLVHKGNIMKFTEGAFQAWGYELALREFRDRVITEDELLDQVRGPDGVSLRHDPGRFRDLRNGREAGDPGGKVVVKDRICDAMFQHALLSPKEYSVLATPNLNGDYLSDAVSAQVGGLGMAPGANMGDGIAVFEPVHGAAPKYTGQDKANPSALILTGAMMLEYIGWDEAAAHSHNAIGETIAAGQVTADLARRIPGARPLKCSEFSAAVISRIR